MDKRRWRVYVDTSVFGGVFDPEFQEGSNRLFNLARSGELVAVVSDLTVSELALAPPAVQSVLTALPIGSADFVTGNEDVVNLRDRYIAAGALSPHSLNDAWHVAHATLQRADVLVSWNFKHIVNAGRIRVFNGVNLANGYGIVTILSPADIREESDEPE